MLTHFSIKTPFINIIADIIEVFAFGSYQAHSGGYRFFKTEMWLVQLTKFLILIFINLNLNSVAHVCCMG